MIYLLRSYFNTDVHNSIVMVHHSDFMILWNLKRKIDLILNQSIRIHIKTKRTLVIYLSFFE